MQGRLSVPSSASAKLLARPSVQANPLGDRLLCSTLTAAWNNRRLRTCRLCGKAERASTVRSARTGLGIITGRSLAAARQRFIELQLPDPSGLDHAGGNRIHYGQEDQADRLWAAEIGMDWQRQGVENALADLADHMELQKPEHQGQFKVSYLLRQPGPSVLPLIRQRLRQHGQHLLAPHLRCHWFLDVLPLRASRSEAIRFLSLRWSLPLERFLVVASQQGDLGVGSGLPAAVVPADHDPCLDGCRQQQRVYFANRA